jgi:hypothetical protein
MAYPFFTIGHSTRTVSQFVDLLQASQIELVVDVRHIPRSRTNPQFNQETLADDLATVQIGYAHVAALSGLRKSSRADISPNLFWDQPELPKLRRLRNEAGVPSGSDPTQRFRS